MKTSAASISGLIVCMLSCSMAAEVRAQEASERVLIVQLEGSAGIGPRLAGELRSRGFEVVVRPVTAHPTVDDLERLVLESGALAAISVRTDARRLQIWVADRVTGKTVIRSIEGADAADDGVIARRAVELLRASLLEVQVMQRVERDDALPEPVESLVEQAEEGSRYQPSLRISTGLSGSVGGLGASWILGIRGTLRAAPRLWVQPIGRISGAPVMLSVDQGRVDWSTLSLGAAAQLRAREPNERFDPHVGVVAFATRARASGVANATFIGTVETTWVARVGAQLGARTMLTERIGAVAELELSRSATRIAVAIDGEPIARWGELIGVFVVGVDVALD